MEKSKKRLFFGFEVFSPWLASYPRGRLIQENERHMTVAFLGEVDFEKLMSLIPSLPLPLFKVGGTGYFDKIIFLPKRHPHVVAWHFSLLNPDLDLSEYVQGLSQFLEKEGLMKNQGRDFLPHVTIARDPFQFDLWRKNFEKLPLFFKNLHLYESLGHSHYQPLWSYPLLSPFEELDHTADIGFRIRGKTYFELFLNAVTALAFKNVEVLKYKKDDVQLQSIDDIIIELNHIISRMDMESGSPFKAVSFHGDLNQEKDGTLLWEMIVDV